MSDPGVYDVVIACGPWTRLSMVVRSDERTSGSHCHADKARRLIAYESQDLTTAAGHMGSRMRALGLAKGRCGLVSDYRRWPWPGVTAEKPWCMLAGVRRCCARAVASRLQCGVLGRGHGCPIASLPQLGKYCLDMPAAERAEPNYSVDEVYTLLFPGPLARLHSQSVCRVQGQLSKAG